MTDTDGSETLAVSVSGIPVGATLTDGTHSFTAIAGQTSVDVSSWAFASLTIVPKQGFTGDFQLTVSATATDHATLSTGAATNSKSVSQTIDIVVAPSQGTTTDHGTITDVTWSNGSVAENAANNKVVGTVHGVDTLTGEPLSYTLLDNAGGRFAIDAATGVITVANGSLLDFEAAASHGVSVQVKDQTTGQTVVKTFNIAVTNVNEAPTDEKLTAGGSVVGNAANGTSVATIQGIDPDAGGHLSYSLVDNAGGRFAIDAATGVITVANGSLIDFATATSHVVNVRVTDQDGLTFDKTFTIAVTAPGIQLIAKNEHAVGNEDTAVSIAVSTLIADSTNPSGATLQSVGNAQHGTVKLVGGNVVFTPSANFSGAATFDYTLVDASGHSSTATVTMDVAPVADAPNLSFSQVASGSGSVTAQNEFLVNTTKTGGQFLSSVSTLTDGGYVIAWTDTSYSGADADGDLVRAQRYFANGQLNGKEFVVDTAIDGSQREPKTTALANGGFVITWEDNSGKGGDASGSSIKARVYDSNGHGGSEILVNTTTAGSQNGAAITTLSDGRFVVSWEDEGGDGSGSGIRARVFNADGSALGSDFLVNTVTTGDQDLVSVASLKGSNAGNFVVTWQDNSGLNTLNNDDTRAGSIKAQVYSIVDGVITKVGVETLVDTKGINFANDVAHVTGLSDGGFAVSWEASTNFGPDRDDSAIKLQLFNANGTKRGSEIVVNTSGDEYQRKPVLRELSNGNIVVVWDDESEENGDADGHSIKAQVLDANGNRVGGEFLVNASTRGDQQFSSVDALANGSFIVTWTDSSGVGDPEDDSVKARIFTVGTTTQDTAVKLNLAANLTDTDGSETLAVSVSGIPDGAVLTDGVHSFTAMNGAGVVDVTGWSFGSLTITPAQGFSGDFHLTVSATATETAAPADSVNRSKAVSQTIDIVVAPATQQAAALVSPNTAGGAGNDVLLGGSGNDVLTGGGGSDTYQFGHGGGQDRIVNGTAASTGPSGELDFGAGIKADQLWFQRNGNDLSISVMGSHDQVTVGGWFGGAGAQLTDIKLADGTKIDAGVSQLVQAMATYSSSHAGFDPTSAAQAPNDAGLQNAIATTWHA